MKYYRGYILVRLKEVGSEWKVVDKTKNLASKEEGEDWKVTYVSPVYGGWDLMVEVSFSKLEELDKIVTYLRIEEDLSKMIEETTTLVATKPNWPFED